MSRSCASRRTSRLDGIQHKLNGETETGLRNYCGADGWGAGACKPSE
jgi:hypothetical protein